MGDLPTTFKLFGMGEVKQTKFSTTSAPNDLAYGATGSASLAMDTKWIRFEPAFRFTYFLPTTITTKEEMMDETVGLNIGPRMIPVRLQLNETFRQQDKSRQINNDITEIIVQADF